jgi:hypothetical protein
MVTRLDGAGTEAGGEIVMPSASARRAGVP